MEAEKSHADGERKQCPDWRNEACDLTGRSYLAEGVDGDEEGQHFSSTRRTSSFAA